ncbi:hypothetical protein TSOC_000609 [Tetrabaena socialis]|uniref:Uncharacterized protein n=1 Tax=Tetrabaena socialis TaxID=47790 RepID=A0A2J8AIW4_9CHLO|nr:hypothetical protein TSOC_000609 [Tetrabaena socialis]|eukprot:PNH12448.1 hypothetical protein TSOC_000609 [Tetrabaena socialis]
MIDLDPCSTAEANTRVGAVRFFDAAADGLDPGNVYSGNVFCNPPFGVMAGGESMQGLFLERCLAEYREGRVKQVVLLLKAAVGYAWFRQVGGLPHCTLWERLAFVQPAALCGEEAGEGLRWGSKVQNPHGSVVVYLGPDPQRFAKDFGRAGSVPGFNGWALAG